MISLTQKPRYVVVSPVKDEERYIDETLRSMTRQTLLPLSWVIVDDGSKDRTATIAASYARNHAFIRLVKSERRGPRATGSAEVHAFNQGYELLRDTNHDFVVKLDGDLSFEPEYFEQLLQRFMEQPTLGIASGVYLELKDDGAWKPVKMPSYHAFGACKVVRRACFDAIGGFLAMPGWDTVDEIRALGLGWTTGHFPALHAKHHRPEGSAMGLLKTSAMHGEIHYVTAGDPLFLILKVLHRLTVAPFVFSGLALLFGYLRALVRRRPTLITHTEAGMYNQMLRQRIWSKARTLVRPPIRVTASR